jgi:hypothetical protein
MSINEASSRTSYSCADDVEKQMPANLDTIQPRPAHGLSGLPKRDQCFSHPLTNIKTGPSNIVDFGGPNDPYRPTNWPLRKKIIITALYGFTTCGSTFSSAIYTSGLNQISEHFHIGLVVATLGLSLNVLGQV